MDDDYTQSEEGQHLNLSRSLITEIFKSGGSTTLN